MSWMTKLKILLDLQSAYDEVDKVRAYSKKIEKTDPKKLKWDDLKIFSNKTMDKAKKAIKETLKKAKDAEKAILLDWPDNLSRRAFAIYKKEFLKSGKVTPKTKKALKMYQLTLKIYDQDLKRLLIQLQNTSKKIAIKIKKSEGLRRYADTLEKAFMQCSKIPSLTGTVQNAVFFGLARDAAQYGGSASDLVSIFQRLDKKNTTYIVETRRLIKVNKLWMIWAAGDQIENQDSIRKNEKAKIPKK
jgi:hypothetical protein